MLNTNIDRIDNIPLRSHQYFLSKVHYDHALWIIFEKHVLFQWFLDVIDLVWLILFDSLTIQIDFNAPKAKSTAFLFLLFEKQIHSIINALRNWKYCEFWYVNVVLFLQFFLKDKGIADWINLKIMLIKERDEVSGGKLQENDIIFERYTGNKLWLNFMISFDGLVVVDHDSLCGVYHHDLL